MQTLVNLLTGLINEYVRDDAPREVYEIYFVFAMLWSFGGCLFQDTQRDDRDNFSKWWRQEFKFVKLPEGGSVFDYYVNPGMNSHS